MAGFVVQVTCACTKMSENDKLLDNFCLHFCLSVYSNLTQVHEIL